MIDWRECLCRQSAAASIHDPGSYVRPGQSNSRSPIDTFHGAIRELLLAGNQNHLDSHPITGPFLLAGVVATTEEFVRDIIGALLSICPVSKAHAAKKSILLGSAIWHGPGVVSRGALESKSLASSENIKNSCANFLDKKLSKHDRVFGVLGEYDKLCEIRHGIVHSGAVFPGKNALALGLARTEGVSKIKVGFNELQESASICTEVAVALNLDLFNVFAERWATAWTPSEQWGGKVDNARFNTLWRIFYSDFDEELQLIPNPLSPVKCRNAIKRELR